MRMMLEAADYRADMPWALAAFLFQGLHYAAALSYFFRGSLLH